MSDPASTPRHHALDALRGLAALLVVLFHYPGPPTALTGSGIVRHGYLAVDLFFILSGFVIASSYGARLRTARDGLDFVALRLFRIYPAHLAALGLLVAYEAYRWFWLAAPDARLGSAEERRMLVESLLLLHGVGLTDRISWNFPSWSISSEFGAYLLFALAALLGWTRRAWFGPAAVIFAGGAYALVLVKDGNFHASYGGGFLRCLGGFALGMAAVPCAVPLRRWFAAAPAWRAGLAEAATAGLVLVLMAKVAGPADAALVPAFLALLLVFQADAGPISRALGTRAPRALGRISYSLYLLHIPMLIPTAFVLTPALLRLAGAMGLGAGATAGVLLAGYAALCVAAGWVSHRLVEEPARLFGRRLVRRWRAEPQGATAELAPASAPA